ALSLAVALSVIFVPRLWRETVRHEAYLPELEDMARQNPEDGRLLALLGVRLAQANAFPEAAVTLQRAAAAGATDASVWLTMAASFAAMGDAAHAMAALRLNAHQSSLAPVMEAAQQRCQALRKGASPAELANAICPEGFNPVIDTYGAGSVLNGVAEWWGRRNPEHSGFATRQRWAREQPQDTPTQVLWARP
ncbi:MAG: hypothetical protein JWN98_468, partial [Abditibacteriota bacterium]|nr:hypothetical protein [Abditibacteriota bacterium]